MAKKIIKKVRQSKLFLKTKETYEKWLEFEGENHLAINYVFAIVFANRWPTIPLWGYVIGPPGGTKTEILRSLQTDEFVPISTLNPASLVSGYRDERNNYEDPSLLPKLDGKILVIKDFTSILSMYREKREEVIAQLREAYDGSLSKGFGNIGLSRYESRFGILSAVTPVIDRHTVVSQQLGERFVCFRMREEERMSAIAKAVSNIPHITRMRKELSRAATRLLKVDVPDIGDMRISEEFISQLIYLAEFVSLARTQVTRSGVKRVITHIPEPELGTRLVQQFQGVCFGHAAANGRSFVTGEDINLIKKIAKDTLPSKNQLLLKTVFEGFLGKKRTYPNNKSSWWMETREISEVSDISFETVKETMEDFRLLKMMLRRGAGKFYWKITARMLKTIRKSGVYTQTTVRRR